jgi:hypothetical protein
MSGLKVVFVLENRSGDVKLYERDKELLPFQKEVMNKEGVSFYYHLKDSAFSIEEKLVPKINNVEEGEKINQITFKVLYEENVIFSHEIDSGSLTYEGFSKNEVEVFYFMESIVDKFENEIMEEHKKMVLYKSE